MGKNSKKRRDKKKKVKEHKDNIRHIKEVIKMQNQGKQKLWLRNGQSPGDGVLLVFAITSLMQAFPDRYDIDIDTPYNQLFEGLYANKLIRQFSEEEKHNILNGVPGAGTLFDIGYETIQKSNQYPYFYMRGMLYDLEEKLGIHIPPTEYSGFVTIRDEEKAWYSAPREILGEDVPYWVVNAGWKNDYTAKQWSTLEYQKLIDMFPNEYFVQIGALDANKHTHPELKGPNLINLIGKTDLRQLIRLIWNAYGVITPCSMAMLLSYAIPAHPRFKSKSRACIAITGGREPNHWHQGPNIQYVHTCGMLPCCDYGGCWKSRVEKLNDGEEHDESLCEMPVSMPDGQKVAKCMSMITANDIGRIMQNYIDNRDSF